MSDEDLRELERAFKANPDDPVLRARYERARERSGVLSPEEVLESRILKHVAAVTGRPLVDPAFLPEIAWEARNFLNEFEGPRPSRGYNTGVLAKSPNGVRWASSDEPLNDPEATYFMQTTVTIAASRSQDKRYKIDHYLATFSRGPRDPNVVRLVCTVFGTEFFLNTKNTTEFVERNSLVLDRETLVAWVDSKLAGLKGKPKNPANQSNVRRHSDWRRSAAPIMPRRRKWR